MTRYRWTTCLLLLAMAMPAGVFAQSSSSIRISDSQRTPDVKQIPVSPGESNHIARTVQFQTAFSTPTDGTPQIPDILTGRKPDQPSQTAPSKVAPASATNPPGETEPARPSTDSNPPAEISTPVAKSKVTTEVRPTAPLVPSTQVQAPSMVSPPAEQSNEQPGGNFSTNQTQPAPAKNAFAPRTRTSPGVVYATESVVPPGNAVADSISTQVRARQEQAPTALPKQQNSTPSAAPMIPNPHRPAFVADQNGYVANDNIAPPTNSFTQGNQHVAPLNNLQNPSVRAHEIPMPQRHQFDARSFVPESPAHEIEASQRQNSDSLMTLQTSSPLVKVSTIGPKSVSVNKVSTYKVNVSNLGSAASGSLLVAVNIPGHIELDDADLSSGTPEVEEAEDGTRVLWTIENVQGQSEENMLLKIKPLEPLAFDMDVEWTFVPFSKGARVQVTEPRLTMEISGPSEVKYGEKAIYTITLNNPGTGDAEDVIVALSETLGGEQAAVGTIKPGDRKQFEVELIARDAGQIDLGATVTADGEIRVPAAKPITVRRAKLEVIANAPNFRYAGSDIIYDVTVTNVGDAVASNVLAAIALPKGAEYISGIEGAAMSEEGDALRWTIGTMTAASKKSYSVRCVLKQPGMARLEAGARGDGQLAHSSLVTTKVDALADLTMTVVDPRGPQQVGDEVTYLITLENRGTKEATNVKLVGQFSPGIEPIRTDGLKSQIVPGSVAFETIPSIPVGRKISLKVYAKAADTGNHTFRAELNCVDQDIRRVFEGTTKYFVAPDSIQNGGERVSDGTIDNGFSR